MKRRQISRAWQRLLRAWFGLTEREQQALALVLLLFLLGLAVRYGRLWLGS